MIEWVRMVETLIASFAGAGSVVIIDWIVEYYIYKRKNFQKAIAIQLALNQMLSASLNMRLFYNEKQEYFSEFYSNEKIGDPKLTWKNFKHIDLPCYMNSFEIIHSDWDFTQFLSHKANNTRDILKYLVPANLGYQSLMTIVSERNRLLQIAHKKIMSAREFNKPKTNFEYQKNNLDEILDLALNKKLRDVTEVYIDTIDKVIVDCKKAFDSLSGYINKSFCHCTPLSLNIQDKNQQILCEVITPK